MRKTKWLVLALILPAFPAASAQRLDALQSGVRVRIVTPKLDRESQLARVVEASDDSVVFRSEAYPITRRLALADVDSLSVSAGQKNSTARYGLYGFLAGALSARRRAVQLVRNVVLREPWQVCRLQLDVHGRGWGRDRCAHRAPSPGRKLEEHRFKAGLCERACRARLAGNKAMTRLRLRTFARRESATFSEWVKPDRFE